MKPDLDAGSDAVASDIYSDISHVIRVVVIGTSGAGKTTFASDLAAALGLNHTELDQLHWGPDWKPEPTEQFVHGAAQAAAGQRWVMDGNYSVVRDQLWPRATHVVWLNYGRWTVFSRVLWRTIRRATLGTRLFHGNRESWRSAFFSRDSILLWSWQTFAKNQRKYRDLRASGQFAQAQWLEFRTPQQTRQWLESLRSAAGAKSG